MFDALSAGTYHRLDQIFFMGFFKPITELLSQSFLRRLMFDKVLLVLEAEQLATQVEALVQCVQVKTESEFDKVIVKKEMVATIKAAQQKTQEVTQKSMFAFFKEESVVASKNLNGILEEAVQTAAFL